MDAVLLRQRKSRGSRAPVCDCRQMMLMSGGCRTTCCCNTSCIIQHARYTSIIQAFSSSRYHILQYSCTYRLLSEGYILLLLVSLQYQTTSTRFLSATTDRVLVAQRSGAGRRTFDQALVGSIPGRGVIRAPQVNSAFHPSGVGKSSTSLTGLD